MAGLARRLAPAAALGGLALAIVGVADPALAGHTDSTATGDLTTTQGSADAQTDTSTRKSTGSTTGSTTAGTVTGEAVMTRWGPVQVAATITDGQLVEAHAVAWPSNDGRSLQINGYAIPILDASATQAGTQFDYVSGATYTSEAYRQSLQSLLDSL